MSERAKLTVQNLFLVQENLRLEQERTIADLREALERIAALGRDEDGAEVPGDFLMQARDIARDTLASLSPPHRG